jgi:hypothetical protein
VALPPCTFWRRSNSSSTRRQLSPHQVPTQRLLLQLRLLGVREWDRRRLVAVAALQVCLLSGAAPDKALPWESMLHFKVRWFAQPAGIRGTRRLRSRTRCNPLGSISSNSIGLLLSIKQGECPGRLSLHRFVVLLRLASFVCAMQAADGSAD